MRPVGEIRQAMRHALSQLCEERGSLVFEQGVTHTELAQRAQVAFDKARLTAKDMARAGELVELGVRPEPGVNRGKARYAPAVRAPSVLEQLDDLLRCWACPR